MAHFLLVGNAFSGLTDQLKNHNHTYTTLKDYSTAARPNKKLKNRIVCDFSKKETILATVDELTEKIDGVITVYENYVLATAWIAQHLDLPGMPISSAVACTDKWAMRSALANATEPINPDFALVEDESDLHNFATNHEFPLMLKPANLVKSLLITKNDSLDELITNYRHMKGIIGEVYQKYAQNREPKIIVEEFLTGSMHTVAGFADQAGNPHLVDEVVDLQLARDIGHDDNFLYGRQVPSRLSYEDQNAICKIAKIGMQALGMKNSPAHVELILTPKGPRVVEIGARNGGYRERMHQVANGIDLAGAAFDSALGKAPELHKRKEEHCAVLELFPKHTGVFVEIEHGKKVAALPSCTYFGVKVKPGDIIGKAADGFKRCAIIILHNENKEQFEADLDFVNHYAKVVTLAP